MLLVWLQGTALGYRTTRDRSALRGNTVTPSLDSELALSRKRKIELIFFGGTVELAACRILNILACFLFPVSCLLVQRNDSSLIPATGTTAVAQYRSPLTTCQREATSPQTSLFILYMGL